MSDGPTTALCTSSADDILIRGRSLPRELIGQRSFRAPTVAEQQLFADSGERIDLTAAESICANEAVNCGFGTALVGRWIGDEDLPVESIDRWGLRWRAGSSDRT